MQSISFYFMEFGDNSINTKFNKLVNAVLNPGNPYNKYTHVVMTIPCETLKNHKLLIDNYDGGTTAQAVKAVTNGTAVDTVIVMEQTESVEDILCKRYPHCNLVTSLMLPADEALLRKFNYLVNYAPSVRIEFFKWLLIRLRIIRQSPVYTCNYNVIQLLKVLGCKISFAATVPETLTTLQTQELK
jgi:hypothetical protein